MEDLSLHLLDIVENSLRAGAQNISVKLMENRDNQTLMLEITDDGIGMDEETLNNAMNPFFSTKNGKKFGLGLPLLSQACEETGGKMIITSRDHRGIKISAIFKTDNIDIKPIGDINKTLRVLRAAHPYINLSFEHVLT